MFLLLCCRLTRPPEGAMHHHHIIDRSNQNDSTSQVAVTKLHHFYSFKAFQFLLYIWLHPPSLPSPPPYLPLLLWVSVLEETSSDHLFVPVVNSQQLNRDDSEWKWDFNLIRHWLNWFLLHFTGHHATQRKKKQIYFGNVK